jgi:hypothetical protein
LENLLDVIPYDDLVYERKGKRRKWWTNKQEHIRHFTDKTVMTAPDAQRKAQRKAQLKCIQGEKV